MSLLECVPNVSEGRRTAVFDRLAATLGGHSGVRLLDASRDRDHNRSVFTLAGDAAALLPALLDLCRLAIAEIDLAGHSGVHPRIGAVDVVPFVPLGETPMATAVAAARRLGLEVAGRFAVPVYLYEEAATAAHRRTLAELRRGGVEGLRGRLARSVAAGPAATGRRDDWLPDFGPTALHPTAGATAIGARGLLIAANALLDTDDLQVAQAVARAVRESSGGLPAVRALALLLPMRGRAQVSMNLVDFRRTPPAVAFAAVAAEAARHGIPVIDRELIGLVPAAALAGDDDDTRALRREWAGRTLEERLDRR